jgi:hypothetical protein
VFITAVDWSAVGAVVETIAETIMKEKTIARVVSRPSRYRFVITCEYVVKQLS